MMIDYSRFKVEDFVADEYFIRWVKSADGESNAFWTAWLSANPNRREEIAKAREIILVLDLKIDRLPEDEVLGMWENIITEKHSEEGVPALLKHTQIRRKIYVTRIAASVSIIIAIGLGLFIFTMDSRKVVATGFGESITIFLPDSSKVTLNSNSKLEFDERNFMKTGREVWLEGEGFFSVSHKKNNENFVVHSKQMDVEVLGTKFDMNSRRERTLVVLEEGQVRVHDQVHGSPPIVMKPGELVEIASATAVLRKKVNVQEYTSWKSDRLVFVEKSLLEIGRMLEDNYGYKIHFGSEDLLDRKFTGSASSDNPEELLETLELVFDLEIKKEQDKILIQHK